MSTIDIAAPTPSYEEQLAKARDRIAKNLPGSMFGAPGKRHFDRHDAGLDDAPFVAGTGPVRRLLTRDAGNVLNIPAFLLAILGAMLWPAQHGPSSKPIAVTLFVLAGTLVVLWMALTPMRYASVLKTRLHLTQFILERFERVRVSVAASAATSPAAAALLADLDEVHPGFQELALEFDKLASTSDRTPDWVLEEAEAVPSSRDRQNAAEEELYVILAKVMVAAWSLDRSRPEPTTVSKTTEPEPTSVLTNGAQLRMRVALERIERSAR